jgi:cytidyltransferase-like protein
VIFATINGLLNVGIGKHILLDGCFDPLHAGHVRYLRAARKAFSDWRLVVAVASDADIREKGREPLFGQMSRCAVVDGIQGVDYVLAKDRPLHEVISALKPAALVKGQDWEGKLDPEVMTACALNDVHIVYLGETLDSSSDRLRRWALQDAEQSLDRLEAFMAQQEPANPEVFDKAYFQGDWRADGNTYTFEKRKEIEGKHPQLIKDCFPGLSILDVGCGPGYLVRLLKELGVNAAGIDTSPEAVAMALDRSCVVLPVERVPAGFSDVAISRETIEHIPVYEIPAFVCDLFRVARRFVYITTRFSSASVFDAATEFDVDPTHISLLSQPFLRSLCVLNGGKRRRDLETTLDHMGRGRVLVYECL